MPLLCTYSQDIVAWGVCERETDRETETEKETEGGRKTMVQNVPFSFCLEKSQSNITRHSVLRCEEFSEIVPLVFTWGILSLFGIRDAGDEFEWECQAVLKISMMK